MSPAPRTIDEYLKQLRSALAGEDAALIQDALYDAEEYLRSEVAAHQGKSEGDVLEIIASTYGDPEEVAAAYRETEAKVKAHLAPAPRRAGAARPVWIAGFFGVYKDSRAYLSLFYMLLALVTGVFYFTFVVTGLSLCAGLAVMIFGIPVFLAFIGLTRVISLGEGRLLEAITGQRMPRRGVHLPAGPALSFWQRIVEMVSDARTWTTLLYLFLMLPLGTLYFSTAVTGLALGLELIAAPFVLLATSLGWLGQDWVYEVSLGDWSLPASASILASVLLAGLGVLVLTLMMHAARSITAGHARLAKALLVEPGA